MAVVSNDCTETVVTYLIVMMPKDVLWWFGTELDDASQIDVTADIDVKLRTAQNHRLGS